MKAMTSYRLIFHISVNLFNDSLLKLDWPEKIIHPLFQLFPVFFSDYCIKIECARIEIEDECVEIDFDKAEIDCDETGIEFIRSTTFQRKIGSSVLIIDSVYNKFNW